MPRSTRSVEAASSVAFDGWTVLVCEPDGSIDGGGAGLYDRDARVLSRHVLRLDGERLPALGAPIEAGRRWSATLQARREGGSAVGPALPQDAWAVEIVRLVGPGMRETIAVRNHAMTAARATLTLDLGADFADALLRGEPGGPRGRLRTSSGNDRNDGEGNLPSFEWTAHRARTRDRRQLRVRCIDGDRPVLVPARAAGSARLSWDLRLEPKGEWRSELAFEVRDPQSGAFLGPDSAPERDALRLAWQARRTRCEAEPTVGRAFEQAAEDLLALRNWELETSTDGSSWVVNAGVPWFTGLFGRDVLTSGWQAAMLGPEILRGAIEIAARTQGEHPDAWTEEEPGRVIHELRRGPLPVLGLRPTGGYYGNHTASSLFPVVLSEAWHWTGDGDLLARHRAAAWRTIEWARRFGDRDGDGFLEYQSSSPDGLRNQGWKDSDEAIRWPDGSIVDVPISTIEEQAFHVLALERMAEILVALDEPGGEADELLDEAAELQGRIDDAFWLPQEAFHALALDPAKQPVASIASNPLHALAAGIVPIEKARTVADRLLDDDLFSGWGIRTLAASHPAYNPFAYHLGTVWPVENATAMIGLRRYGLDDHLDRLLDGFFGAVATLGTCRLPEALTGHARQPGARPLPYPGGNPIQAWSASAVVQATQAMLGIYPFAPAGILALVRPRLPRWLPSLTLRRLRVGRATLSLRFERNADGSASHEVLEQDGPLLVVAAPPPNASSDRSPYEWLADFGISHAPGRLGRSLRIALGRDARLDAGARTPSSDPGRGGRR